MTDLFVESEDGLELEAALDGPEDAMGAIVLCHPHPKMGGTMNAPLLLALKNELTERRWAVLRFNFRGIGASEGESSDGIAEVADARGAIEWVRSNRPSVPLALAGWSFGAAVAVRVAAGDDSLAACALVAPPVNPRPGITAGVPRGVSLRMPLLVVCGSNDELVSPVDCGAWAAETGARFVEVAGANHFFWGKYEDLADLVAGFLDDVTKEPLDER